MPEQLSTSSRVGVACGLARRSRLDLNTRSRSRRDGPPKAHAPNHLTRQARPSQPLKEASRLSPLSSAGSTISGVGGGLSRSSDAGSPALDPGSLTAEVWPLAPDHQECL